MKKSFKMTMASLIVTAGVYAPVTMEAATKYIAYSSNKANSVAKTKAEIKKYPIRYKVKNNDSVVNIAKAAGVSVTDFIKANQIKDPKKIKVGTYVLAIDSVIYSQLKKGYSYSEYIETDYKTIKKVNANLDAGTSKVLVKGVKGRNKLVTTYKYIKGVKTITSEKVTVISKPINKVIEYGPNATAPSHSVQKLVAIPYKNKTIEDPNLLEGDYYLKQKGKDGQKRVTYNVLELAPGVEVSDKILKEEIISSPIDAIEVVGTKK